MKVSEIVQELSLLVQLEVDAIAAYDAAVALAAGAGSTRDELALFRVEHQRHALALYDVFMRLGQRPPAVAPDVKGIVIGALSAPRPPRSVVELLEGLRGDELLAASTYAKALARPLPSPVRELVERTRDEERHHVDWIERAISRLGGWTSVAANP